MLSESRSQRLNGRTVFLFYLREGKFRIAPFSMQKHVVYGVALMTCVLPFTSGTALSDLRKSSGDQWEVLCAAPLIYPIT